MHPPKVVVSWATAICIVLAIVIPESNSCSSLMSSFLPKSFGGGTQRSSDGGAQRRFSKSVTRINSPGQRFTATHGISAKAGEKKLFLFVVDQEDVNYLAVSSNVAIEGTRGGPERYELYMKYGAPPTTRNYDQRSTLTASDSYVGDVLYSRDITVPRPALGEYYFLLVAFKDFHELLVTAIMDMPPDEHEAAFTIRRMGHFAH